MRGWEGKLMEPHSLGWRGLNVRIRLEDKMQNALFHHTKLCALRGGMLAARRGGGGGGGCGRLAQLASMELYSWARRAG